MVKVFLIFRDTLEMAVKCGWSETATRMDIDGEVIKKTRSGGELFELFLANRDVVTTVWAFLPW